MGAVPGGRAVLGGGGDCTRWGTVPGGRLYQMGGCTRWGTAGSFIFFKYLHFLYFFQFCENPWTQNKVLGLNPTKRFFSRQTLVRRIQEKLIEVEEIVLR